MSDHCLCYRQLSSLVVVEVQEILPLTPSPEAR